MSKRKAPKKLYASMRLHSGCVSIATFPKPTEVKMSFPEGCVGLIFAFKTKKAAREYWGKDIELLQLETD